MGNRSAAGLPRVAAGAEERDRFRREAEAISRVRHPNIVQVFDVGKLDRQPYLAMEYCERGSLADQLRGTPREARQSAEWARQIANGIAAAHVENMIHRDLKPGNILIDGSGTLKITDFGLAKILDDDQGATRSGTILGTPSYMAPEQASADGVGAWTSADIYAVGAVLYECLTGAPPHQGPTTIQTLEQLRTRNPLSARQLQPSLPRDLETIVHKCLQRRPQQRYATAEDLAGDLDRYLDGRPILARPTSPRERCAKWARRRPSAASSLGGATLAVLVLLITWGVFTARLNDARIAAEKDRDQVRTQTARAERNADWAMEAVDELLTKVGEQQLADVPRMDQVRKELLASAAEFCRKFLDDKDNPDPDARNELALAHRRLAKIHRFLGEHEPWLRESERSIFPRREWLRSVPRVVGTTTTNGPGARLRPEGAMMRPR